MCTLLTYRDVGETDSKILRSPEKYQTDYA